ncbi:MAG: DNA-binding response regulator [Ignavibacteria bacterium GWA2_35_9]|nr:MAG: DNA-binding response regulator [Ignavibacteria bacterium GWA2_35_9]OGU43263.1 MAG: DNA-binding response regulator [Ignavibacteria bacterium GWB2_36_8]OGU53318.1 MAG: DNA-binding response regulator [Ignavibacteria bacterium GWC2_36_12]
MIKVFIADDHSLIREGFKKLLKDEMDIEVVGEAGNAKDTMEFVLKNNVDVLSLDINLPDKSGLDLLKELREFKPGLRVLILSMHPEDRFAMRVLKAGAFGYVTKESAGEELVKAIRKVHNGGKYVSATLAEKLVFEIQSGSDKPVHEILSDREFQVFQMIASGKTLAEIADSLSLAVTTVSTYRARILEKLNLHSNAELIHYAITNKLLD